eukprot:TRINITY_DN20867_c0_g2_i2.p1 TRINITY_DN20867_c0_g2~~TRINITY_DN20867_c0_g2_i2.p1  ORF type:complete len:448 (-),score=59.52 TRINITY_DN20867_c0_g2_i2:605-1927(-)
MLTKEEQVKASKEFQELGVCSELADTAAELGWKKPTSIQQQAIPHSIQGKDVIGLAETGSGKTGAFVIPILQDLLKKQKTLFALVLSPTRELAIQIADQFKALGCNIGMTCVTLVGGVDIMQQAIALSRRPHVIIGTPGRVLDHLKTTKGFHLKTLQHFVLDEADKLLDLDFEDTIDAIVGQLPTERTTALFSATMSSKVQKLQRACLRNPVKVEVSQKYQTVSSLDQKYLFFPAKYKDTYLVFLLVERLSTHTMIVFVNTADNTRKLSYLLSNLNYKAIPINGRMTQPKRLAALNKFKSGEKSILIATDVASRGLDIPTVDVVINYDLPKNCKDYVHRVGRTARAGRSGRALTFVTQYDVGQYQRIEKLIEQKLEEEVMDREEVKLLQERVAEAARLASLQIKEADSKKKKRRVMQAEDMEEETVGVNFSKPKKKQRKG